MSDKTLRVCNYQGCSLKGMKVTTAIVDCLSCGRELSRVDDWSALGDIFGGMFGGRR